MNNNTDDSNNFFTLSGIKPDDSSIKVHVRYFGRGESCPGKLWNEGAGKLSSGVYRSEFKFDKNLSSYEGGYKFHLPYENIKVNNGCMAKLSEINIVVYSNKIAKRLTSLRIYNGNGEFYPFFNINDHLEDKECGPINSKFKDVYSCQLYINGKNAYPNEIRSGTVDLNFSEINSNSNLSYDIVKGADY